jgi:hypothetical protein
MKQLPMAAASCFGGSNINIFNSFVLLLHLIAAKKAHKLLLEDMFAG